MGKKMHGLVNRSIQCFLRDAYGAAVWDRVARASGAPPEGFEAMLAYDAGMTDALVAAAARVLGRPVDTLLEDLGTYLVSHPNVEGLRRLLRFGGEGYEDFLLSLEDLPERGRMALSGLDLPALHLADLGGGVYSLSCSPLFSGIGHVAVGLLRAMADDYGALVLLDHAGPGPGGEVVTIHLLDHAFAEGRQFDLAATGGR